MDFKPKHKPVPDDSTLDQKIEMVNKAAIALLQGFPSDRMAFLLVTLEDIAANADFTADIRVSPEDAALFYQCVVLVGLMSDKQKGDN